jgi:hypothetical protein
VATVKKQQETSDNKIKPDLMIFLGVNEKLATYGTDLAD